MKKRAETKSPKARTKAAENSAKPADHPRSNSTGKKVILVPIDFSTHSKMALRKALEFAGEFGASLVVLHVMDPIYSPGRLQSASLRQLKRYAQKSCRHELTRFVKGVVDGDLKPRVILQTGVPHVEIAEAAKREDAELVVLGSRGKKGLKRLLLGSTAERVLRDAHCPVLVVR